MTNEQILYKAIEKAEKNGWVYPINEYQDNYYLNYQQEASLFIFTHDFAKAFWGEEFCDFKFKYDAEIKEEEIEKIGYNKDKPWFYEEIKGTIRLHNWQYHLQQMVLEEEPLKYLEKFLGE